MIGMKYTPVCCPSENTTLDSSEINLPSQIDLYKQSSHTASRILFEFVDVCWHLRVVGLKNAKNVLSVDLNVFWSVLQHI